jgi:MFS family permease
VLAHLSSVSALLAGLGIVLVGSGLLGTLLPIRAGEEGFGDLAIGIIQSAYYVGFVAGTVVCSRVIRRVGNIRAFATFAAVATVSILAHAVFVTPAVWMLLRALVGASLIGIYITVESWLNARADRSNRGRILAVYEVVGLGALAGGQFLITVGDVASPLPFLIAASLFAAGLIPVALTRLPEPDLATRARLTVRTLFAVSPVAVVGTLAGATASGAFFGLGPLYAQKVGLASAGIAAYMSAALIGGALLQWPIGGLSDRMDRRIVIGGTAAIAGVAAIVIVTVSDAGIVPLLVATFLYGGTMLVLYSLCVAHANDLLPQAQFLDAARGFNFLYGVGAAVAPAALGASMARFGSASLFLVSAVLLLGLGVFALLRAMTSPVVAVEAREEFVAVSSQTTEALELHPHKPLEPAVAADGGRQQ